MDIMIMLQYVAIALKDELDDGSLGVGLTSAGNTMSFATLCVPANCKSFAEIRRRQKSGLEKKRRRNCLFRCFGV